MITFVKDSLIEPRDAPPERRRGLRIGQNRPVKLLDSAAARYFGGRTHDVSATGLRIELPSRAPIRPGKLVSIHVGVGRSGEPLANRRNMIPARVVWVRRGEQLSNPTITAGVEFLASVAAHLDAA